MSPQTLLARLAAFRSDQSGAVTADWVLITAAALALALAASATVGAGVESQTDAMSAGLDNVSAQMGWAD